MKYPFYSKKKFLAIDRQVLNRIMKFFQNLKNGFHDYIEANTHQNRAIAKIEKFFNKTSVLSYHTFSDYKHKNQAKRSIWPCLLGRFVLAVYWLKFFIPVVFSTEWAKWMTCEFCYIIGNPFLFSIMICLLLLLCITFSLHIQYEEWNQTLYILDFMDDIKNNCSELRLSPRYQRKLCLRINFFFDYLIIVYLSQVVLVSLVFITSLILAYIDPNTGYSLILTIFWSVMSILVTFYGFSTFALIFLIWFFTTLYFKYKFNEINDSFIKSHKFLNKYSFLKDIESHNRFVRLMDHLNRFLSWIIFFVYYFGTPGVQMVCYITHEKSTIIMVRLVSGIITCVAFSIDFGMNLLSANVIHSAHKPYRLLYNFFY